MRKTYNSFTIGILYMALALFIGCSPDDDDVISYTIPATYNFENVSYSGQTARLNMFTELKAYMGTSKIAGISLDANKLAAMFANNADQADWTGSYDASKQLRSKTFESSVEEFDLLLDRLAQSSTSTTVGSNGVAGVIESNDGSKRYLISAKGIDEAQLFEKGLMGACIYYQATSVYFGSGKMDVDNTTVTTGEGTEMEHHWDEAFGYFGVPINFPTDKDGIVFWGNYSNGRDALLNCNQALMDAFIKGRAAISNSDLDTRDEAISEAREIWEEISVGTALHYLNAGLTNFDDKAIALHGLSEAIGFIYSLKFNEARKMDNSAIDELLVQLAGSADFAEMNLYNTTIDDITQVRNNLASTFDLTDLQDQF